MVEKLDIHSVDMLEQKMVVSTDALKVAEMEMKTVVKWAEKKVEMMVLLLVAK